MATSLAEIRAKLQAQENRTQGGGKAQSDNTIYPHWNIAEGTTSRIRFLPDASQTNSYFWVERAMIKLPFAGIKGQPDSKPVIVQVPCVEMWNEACPILAEVRPWFKDPALEELGRKYWKKRSYLFQGFVRDNPMSDDKTPENPIRRFIISPQIFNLVKTALMDPEMDNLPTDYAAGLDFNIKKTSKGGYADYNTSTWSRKESALTVDEAEAIEKYGLFNLSEFLPKRPTATDLQVMKEMFEASVDGQAYDSDKWAAYFKPAGFKGNDSDTGTSASGNTSTISKPTATPPWSDDSDDGEAAPAAPAPAPAPAPAASTSSRRAEDILALIRSRQK